MSRIATTDYQLRKGWRCLYFQFTADFVDERTPEQVREYMLAILESRLGRAPKEVQVVEPRRHFHLLPMNDGDRVRDHYYDARIEYQPR